MKLKFFGRMLSLLLLVATLMTAPPITVIASAAEEGKAEELYIKSVKLVQAGSAEEAEELFAEKGYTLLDRNLNEGTGEDGIWLGYTTTTDPKEAIYDMKVMNMKGGFTLSSVKEALALDDSAFAAMAADLGYLIEEFTAAYEAGSVPAQKAYKALNFFRLTEDETATPEENGLGYTLVRGMMSTADITEMLVLCNSELVDSVVRILAMGIGIASGNWMQRLSDRGPYEAGTSYGEDIDEVKRRAEQLLLVLEVYSAAYNSMEKSGLIPDGFDENGEPIYNDDHKFWALSAEEMATRQMDAGRYKIYKAVFDELAKYPYGTEGKTLKDFFMSIEDEGSAKDLYPLVSVLSDGEFAALSYGCFLELALGATASPTDYDRYDEVYAKQTEEVSSVYLYGGVDKHLREEDTVIGFTDEATRHMASTGQMEFYEKVSYSEWAWQTGVNVAKGLGACALVLIGAPKLLIGTTALLGFVSTTVASAAKTGIYAAVLKYCSFFSGTPVFLGAVVAVLTVLLVSYIVSVASEAKRNSINWDENPMPEYLYDIMEVTIKQASENEGIETEYTKRSVYALYEAVTDFNDEIVDLNARSDDATQWIGLYVSRDAQGENAKPIRAEGLTVRTGNGEAADGEVPLSRFGQVIAYNLNQWDGEDDVNGIYLFYQQDTEAEVKSNTTYYVSEVYLQAGESTAHCIELLEAAGYTPLNVNLSPDTRDEDNLIEGDLVYTYLGYKVTTNKNNAIRDLRVIHGYAPSEVKLGYAGYAECGSNGELTLFATKYKEAGTPILANGIICVHNRADAPAGYEPVNFFSGGPAAPFNLTIYGDRYGNIDTFLYFLPETTFTSGKEYLGGIAYMRNTGSAAPAPLAFRESGYEYSVTAADQVNDSVVYHSTYNPYRAIYSLRATNDELAPSQLTYEGINYALWTRINWYTPAANYEASFSYDGQGVDNGGSGWDAPYVNGRLFLAGNPKSENTYNETEKKMSSVQPILLSDFMCFGPESDRSVLKVENTSFKPLTDIFAEGEKAVELKSLWRSFSFYVAGLTEKKPYISSIMAADILSVYYANGGAAEGIEHDDINDGVLLAQLANRGATDFTAHRVDFVHRVTLYFGPLTGEMYNRINRIKFGYVRTDKKREALRDVFFYFGGFNTDEPPAELYRGDVKYTPLCEIPYNLTGYESAPRPAVYLYGTTDSRAGEPITDFSVSDLPFMDGYETVRTMNGRSLTAEVLETLRAQRTSGWLTTLYKTLIDFFDNNDDYTGSKWGHINYYLHIKHEGDDAYRGQSPYIDRLYLTNSAGAKDMALDDLFDQGAEGYVDMDLNEDAGGDCIYVGYRYTNDPEEAIRDIRAYHKKNPPAEMTDDDGLGYTLVKNLDVNKDAGGDYIYLYTTKDGDGDPIVGLAAAYEESGSSGRITFPDGRTVTTRPVCTRMWDSSSESDLNDGAGGEYIYLIYSTAATSFVGSAKPTPSYGADKLHTRSDFTGQKADGKYIGGIYVMDKNTIRQEKLAAGVPSPLCECSDISDQEVKDRLKAMGATTVIETPFLVTGEEHFKDNANKVFIGYSRTDTKAKGIRSLALWAEVISSSQPSEKTDANKTVHSLVAEAAKDVTELPHAINLIGVQDDESLLVPRLYLYYATSGTGDPITDIVIDREIFKADYSTVRSTNGLDPYRDISDQAYEQYELANQDDWDLTDDMMYYTDPLFEWMDDVSALFAHKNERITPYYIHYKTGTGTVAEQKPYVSDVYLASGETKNDALSKLLANAPDGYCARNLNEDAGGTRIYLAYKRSAKERDALTGLIVSEGSMHEPAKRVKIGGESVKYDLVADLDLNESAGGEYLYLYKTKETQAGKPITLLDLVNVANSTVKCGKENRPVCLAKGNTVTNAEANLNLDAGGNAIYMLMQRETTEGHGETHLVETTRKEPTCGADGYVSEIYNCYLCSKNYEVRTVLPATGEHVDEMWDGDHRCDVCRRKNASECTAGWVEMIELVAPTSDTAGYIKDRYYCSECEEFMHVKTTPIPVGADVDTSAAMLNRRVKVDSALGASVIGEGSILAVCSFVVLAAVAATIVYRKKKNRPRK